MAYLTLFALLFVTELLYFRIADHFNIVDKPNERSSHSKVVLRGGGVIFFFGALACFVASEFSFPWFMLGLTLVAGISFVDDVHPLPDSTRLVAQVAAMLLLFYQAGMLALDGWWWMLPVGLFVCVGITNVYNFMDGVNGITGGYSAVVLVSLLLALQSVSGTENVQQLLGYVLTAAVVFCCFNFRKKNCAKCFAGDVGSISMAFIILFALALLVLATNDLTCLVLLVVYGVDACLTIIHRIMLHEHLGQAHRKHLYQLLANELGWDHRAVSFLYMSVQGVISGAYIFVIPNTAMAHWTYLLAVTLLLALGYVAFMKRYFHLHVCKFRIKA